MPESSDVRGSRVAARAVIPWKTKKKWDAAAIADYHTTAQSWLRSKAESGLVRDCADTAISLVIEYAAQNGLPVAFKNSKFDPSPLTNEHGRVYYPEGGYKREDQKLFRKLNTVAKYDKTIRGYWNAAMLGKGGHTKKISHSDAKPGDICIIDWSNSTHWHTVLIGERDSDELPVWMVMGNLDNNDQATPLELVKRSDDRSRVERYFKNADLYQSAPRRWDFDFFNSVVK